MFVGEVRWATTGFGSSWKLSGGSAWSSDPTKVSKKRHVRRAVRRRRRSCCGDSGSTRRRARRQADAPGDERRDDPEDEEGRRQRAGSPAGRRRRSAAATTASPTAGAMRAVEAGQVEAEPGLRLRGGHPLEKAPPGRVEADQRAGDRVHHEVRLVGEQGHGEHHVRESHREVGGHPAEVAPLRDAPAARHQMVEHGHERRESDRRARMNLVHIAGSGESVQAARSVRTAEGAESVRRRLSSIFQRPRNGTPAARRPTIHGRSCQSPRAQRCWRSAATW